MQTVQQYFVNPAGLAAFLAIIPLLVFYLVRPKPEREVMPSMAFFQENQENGKIRHALQKLKRNRMLLLHLLFISLLALTLANPVVPGLESEGRTVVVLDVSASMNGDREKVKNFVEKHMGAKNTVITAASQPRIEMREASPESVRRFLNNYGNRDTGTDIVAGIQLASNYPGKLVLASDMDQTASGDLEETLEELDEQRKVKTMELNHENSHGFTDLNVENGEVRAKVRNFLDRNRTVQVVTPSGSRQVEVPSRSSKSISFTPEPGKNDFSLPEDGFSTDNVLHVSVPREREITVKYLGKESPYFRKAVKLINSTRYVQGDKIRGADIYFIGENYRLNGGQEKVEEAVEKGSGVILERRKMEVAPVENYTGKFNTSVKVSEEVASSFQSTVSNYTATGTSLARSGQALVLSDSEDVLFYNVDDKAFGKTITYPLFWKDVFHRMADVKTGSELNLETGRRKEFAEPVTHRGKSFKGVRKITDTGYYEGRDIYAANLLNPGESTPHVSDLRQTETSSKTDRDPAGKYLAALLALFAAVEITYLYSRGELQ